ncbi:hypothetical protein [Virgibacillus sp. MG-45]|uniref:hypothetical protein n=1 Tax=Virgibacillus sp. MG-45 TaxID=3102791 RepID=UPI002EDAEDAC
MSRRDFRKRNKRNQRRKWLAIIFLSVVMTFGSYQLVFADQDMRALIANWLQNKTAESIADIDTVIKDEQSKQTERLKKELYETIKTVEGEWDSFVENEKQERVTALKAYADKLIEDLPREASVQQKEAYITNINAIVQAAKKELEAISLEQSQAFPTEKQVEGE